MADGQGYKGFLDAFDSPDEFGEMWFVIQRLIRRNATAMLVKVVAAHPATDPLSAAPTVDMVPLVHQIDGLGQVTPHATIYNVPCFRLGRGNAAVIMDPMKDDIGLAVFASHDISAVKSTRAAAPPGSRRRFDWADGLYFGSFLTGAITRYIRFSDSQIEVVDPTKIRLAAPTIAVEGNLTVTQDITAQGTVKGVTDVVAGTISGKMHKHTSAAAGSPTSPPIP